MSENLFLKEYLIHAVFSLTMVIFAVSAMINREDAIIGSAVRYLLYIIPAAGLVMVFGGLI